MTASRVAGVLVVRDEVDIVRLCVLHHLSVGCDHILALDNGSSDGTTTVLRRLATRVPLSWTWDAGTYRQSEFVTGLAHEAAGLGVDWILPLDADEFWVAPGGLRAELESFAGLGALEVGRIEFIQRRDQRRAVPAGVLTMTKRVASPLDSVSAIADFGQGTRSMFEVKQGPKLAVRTHPGLVIDRGAHFASHLAGDVAASDTVRILHAPLRARLCLGRKAVHGDRLERAGVEGLQGWQVRHWADRARSGQLDGEWEAHAYGPDGTLQVGPRRVPLVDDYRLATALRRWVRRPAKQMAARALRRTY